MDLFVFNRLFPLLRVLSLYGVMAALLFSCGEGIRLFPFPVQESDQSTALRAVDSDRIQYEENVPRIEKDREKAGRDDSHFNRDLQSAFLARLGFTLSVATLRANGQAGIPAPRAFTSFQAASRLRGRAPPLS